MDCWIVLEIEVWLVIIVVEIVPLFKREVVSISLEIVVAILVVVTSDTVWVSFVVEFDEFGFSSSLQAVLAPSSEFLTQV